MITHYFKAKDGEKLEVLETPIDGSWTHVVAPSIEELDIIIAQFNLDDAIVYDIQDEFEVPRFEQEGHISYFFTRFLHDNQKKDVDTAPILIIMGPMGIITILKEETRFLPLFINGKRDIQTTSRTNLFLEIMSALVADYDKALNLVRKSVSRDVGRVRNISGRDIQRLVLFEQELNEILSALLPTLEWFQQLTKGNHIQMFNEDRELLEDLLIDSSQLADTAKSILKTIQNIRSASEAVLSQRLNSTIRMLTAFTIILTIPTLIASFFGMNVHIPLQDNPYGFWIVLGVTISIMMLTIHFFTRNRWI